MTSLIYIFVCWDHFRKGKNKRKDIQEFERYLEDHIFQLQHDLVSLNYQHGTYNQFYVSDPKQRRISKASVRDRLVHQIVYGTLTTVFDKIFIYHSLSSRLEKGTHVGVNLLRRMIRKVSANGKQPCYALKMDIKRFFDTINHGILKTLLRKKIKDEKALKIIDTIIDSFRVSSGPMGDVGIPLGNATSQLFANVYLHELDDFIKQTLQKSYYLRYCDDFIILSNNENHLKYLIVVIQQFLIKNLQLTLHPNKLIIRKLSQGIDFVGYVLFSKYTLVRTRTKQRLKKRLKNLYETYFQGNIDGINMDQRLQSNLGILSHANEYNLSLALKNAYWVRKDDPIKNRL